MPEPSKETEVEPPAPEVEQPKEPTPEPEPPKEPTPEPEPPKEPTPEPEPPKEPTPEPEPPKEPTPEPEPPKEPTPEPEPPKEAAAELEIVSEPATSDKPAEEPQEKTTPAPVEEAPPAEAGDEVKEKPKPEVTPRTKVRTVNPGEGVDIAMGTKGIESMEPVTVGHVFRQAVKNYPDRDALGYKEGEEWKYIKFPEYYQLCVSAAKSFIKVRDRDCR